MMADNWKRLNIWLKLNNRFDYTEFAAVCRAEGTEPQNALEFAQKAGMVSCGMVAFPELPVSEAYLKFIQDNQPAQATQPGQSGPSPQVEFKEVDVLFPDGHIEKRMVPVQQAESGCPTCGGGKVL